MVDLEALTGVKFGLQQHAILHRSLLRYQDSVAHRTHRQVAGKGPRGSCMDVVGQLLDRSNEAPLLASIRFAPTAIEETQDRKAVRHAL